MLDISKQLSVEMGAIYNQWSRVRITNPELKRVIQIAMVPNKDFYENLKQGKEQELSSHFNNMVSSSFDYAMSSPTQQEETTKGTVFGAYNAVTGYFQNRPKFQRR